MTDINITVGFAKDAEIASLRSQTFSPTAQHAATIPDADRRHVLVIHPENTWTIGHPDGVYEHMADECAGIETAALEFIIHLDHGDGAGFHLRDPGTYWCSLSPEGVFEIGGEVRG